MTRRLSIVGLLTVLFCASPLAFAQRGKNDAESAARSVQGTVTDSAGKAVSGAVVYLKNSKTLQLRSFFTKDDGSYSFHGLSPNVDYDLRAEKGDVESDSRTLSVFDSRNNAVINLKLSNKK